MVLLDTVPGVLRRINVDALQDSEVLTDPGWREVAELRATPGQLSLLRVLVEHERCTMQELADLLVVTPSTVTAMVKRLLAQGYVERSRDEVDWRTVWVNPTERGRQAVNVFVCRRLASLQRRLEQLSEDERSSLIAALPALRRLSEI
jgi:DNA-binding MarR family transcriptional regulator